jgi:AraC-like DNA-binding protein
MTNRTDLIPGVIFFSYQTDKKKEKVAFLEHKTLVFLVAGHFKMETAQERISIEQGQMLLIQKNQLAEITKTPLDGKEYQTIVIRLTEDILRMMAHEEQIETGVKYIGPANIPISGNDFLQAFFQSLLPYARHPEEKITNAVAILKIKEAVYLLLNTRPELRKFLFDFTDPYKLDLEKFMLSNFHYNIPVSRFAQLTGRSLAAFKRDFQKTFGMAPRQWLLERRLEQARHLLEKKNKKPSAFYLDLGFESLSHFSHSFKKKFGKSPGAWPV